MKRCIFLLIICVLLYSASVADQCPVVIRSMPSPCGASIYYDIDLEGNVIEVDYVHAKERVMRHLTFDECQIMHSVGGFCDLNGAYACFYVKYRPTTSTRDSSNQWLARFVLLGQSGGSSAVTSIILNYAGDWVVFPIDRQKVYVQYNNDTQRQEQIARLVFNPLSNSITGKFDFDLREGSLLGKSNDGQHLYVAHPHSYFVTDVDPSTDSERTRVSFDNLNGEAHDQRYVFTVSLSQKYVLIIWKYVAEKEMKLWLYDLDGRVLLAQSKRIPFLYGRFIIELNNGLPAKIQLVPIDMSDGHMRLTGDIKTFIVDSKDIVDGKASAFNVATEIPVMDFQTQKLVITKKKGVGHVSILHVESFAAEISRIPLRKSSGNLQAPSEHARRLLLSTIKGEVKDAVTEKFLSSIQYNPSAWTRLTQDEKTKTSTINQESGDDLGHGVRSKPIGAASQQTTNQTAVGVPQILGSGKTNDLRKNKVTY